MIEFSITEILMVEIALKDYMRREMCTSDRNICQQAYMKLQLSKKGQKIQEAISEPKNVITLNLPEEIDCRKEL